MQPISPVLTEEFVPAEVVYAKDQPEYNPLPSLRNPAGIVMSRWKLTDEEREAVLHGADILLSVWTFNKPLQPLALEVIACERDMLDVAARMGLT
jgi:hypothetical protein